jgi:hypothetical protein
MTHGGLLFPQILPPDTVQKLREHVVERNSHLSELEEIELSQGTNRKSFALDASEADIVSLAIHQVASHPLLKETLQELVGDDDPAVSEITAITSYYGCPDQTWHQDVKADGSPLKFARTYTHSHSLFIALQDTSSEMGATSFCPGSHYCANDGMAHVCEEFGFQLSETPQGVWSSGDAALLSQHVWHRGARHSDPDAPERILFVMTFLARPDLTRDRRQLSRGTYFHMRWNMWGHTFQDLVDAAYSMAKPFSVLRCLGIWKPPNRNWGYDLMTSGLLRCANNQQGMTYYELQVFVDNIMSKLGIPGWLQGPVTEQDDAWQIYLKETLSKSLDFCGRLNLYALGIYLLLVILVATVRRKRSVLTGSLYRLVWTHGIISLLGYHVLKHIYESPFATELRANRMLMRAFPVDNEIDLEDASISTGPLALPERDDVLVGSRFDARFLGAFDRWLDYHPGNKLFRTLVSTNAEYYKDYSSLAPVFREEILRTVESQTTLRGGRFLSQDYQFGLWNVMSNVQVHEYTRQSLLAASSAVLADLNQEIAYMLADYRFGLKRGTVLARISQETLLHWRNDVLFSQSVQPPPVPWSLATSLPSIFTVKSPLVTATTTNAQSPVVPLCLNHKRWTNIPNLDRKFDIGDLIMVHDEQEEEWFRGSIIRFDSSDNRYMVSYEDGGTDNVHADELHPLVRLEQDVTRVRVEFERGEWYPGTVSYIHPNRKIDVEYDDGDFNENVPYWKYQVLVDE